MVNNSRISAHVMMLCLLLCACATAYGMRVESGYVGLDISQQGMTLSYGPEKIIVSGDFYLADKNWKSLFPDAASYEIARAGAMVTSAADERPPGPKAIEKPKPPVTSEPAATRRSRVI